MEDVIVKEIFSTMQEQLVKDNTNDYQLLIPSTPSLVGILKVATLQSLVSNLSLHNVEEDFFYEISPVREDVYDYKQYQFVLQTVLSKTSLNSDLTTYLTIGLQDQTLTEQEIKEIVMYRAKVFGQNLLDDIVDIQLRILHYCNISKVPKDAIYVWANMVSDYLGFKLAIAISILRDTVADDVNGITGKIRSIKVGDTDTEWYAGNYDSSALSTAFKSRPSIDLDSFVLQYQQSLNAFRVLHTI